uniref:SAM domain-containing protein n=1 Tax=Dracunculus medinensis TaxID=318479 RepID=A0A0N4U8A6_DRAME
LLLEALPFIIESLSKSPSPSMSTVSCPEYPELQEKLHRLALARDSLSLQVTVLTEQVGAQKEKIRDLEHLLASKRNKLDSTEELLQEHAFNRGDLESKKLDLMAEVSNLKLKYATLEREKFETERKLRLSQAEIEHLNQSMQGFMMQHGLHPQFQNIQIQAQGTLPQTILNESIIKRTGEPASEMEQLRLAVQRLIVDNEQKLENFQDMHINSLRNALDEYCRYERENHYNSPSLSVQRTGIINGTKKQSQQQQQLGVQPFDINVQIRKLLMEDYNDHIAHSSSFPSNFYSTQQHQNTSTSSRTPSAIQSSSSYTSSLSAASPQHSWSNSGTPRHHVQYGNIALNTTGLSQATSNSPGTSVSNYRSPSSPAARQLAAELDELRRIGGEIQQKHDISMNNGSLSRSLKSAKAASTLTLPRKKLSSTASTGISGEFPIIVSRSAASVSGASRRPMRSYRQQMNKWLHDKILSRVDKRSTSAPNLGPRAIDALCSDVDDYDDDDGHGRRTTASENENEIESDDEVMRGRQSRFATDRFKRDRTRTSLKNLLGKLTRSTSQEIRSSEIRRGSATRSSVSARLASVGPVAGAIALRPPIQQFVDWTTDQICEWIAEIGFSLYVPEVGRFELLMKNVLHRKRLRCILNSINRGISDSSDRMDVHQVVRWLDDIGIPQYGDNFAENMIDGQMLTILTAQDLMEMKITSALHHATIARGIQFLRSIDFCPNRIERHFNPWLKAIDLAEFTPNLLCAGIHGALMVHEPTFTAESLAEVLQIPPHKTLLRRHLATHFNQLLGQDIISHKRTILAQPYVAQLAPSLKIRLVKKGFSLTRKKGKSEVYVEPDELVCPPSNSRIKYSQNFN